MVPSPPPSCSCLNHAQPVATDELEEHIARYEMNEMYAGGEPSISDATGEERHVV